MAGDTDRRPFRASSREMGSNPGGTESVLCKETQTDVQNGRKTAVNSITQPVQGFF